MNSETVRKKKRKREREREMERLKENMITTTPTQQQPAI